MGKEGSEQGVTGVPRLEVIGVTGLPEIAAGTRLGQGLTRYTSDEATAIRGHQSAEIEDLLGYPGRAALIHRDDMAV